ncbi:hypothetical protein KM043_014432 [Ampulex compressa]|nr:hypothetical protein KM043_014432 [Ampulex compressa]
MFYNYTRKALSGNRRKRKMRLTSCCLKRGRAPQSEKTVPFKEMLPLKLRNFVSGKAQQTTKTTCLYEMGMLFACFQEKQFDNRNCTTEVKNFQNCYSKYLSDSKIEKAAQRSLVPIPGQKNLTHKQISYILHQYPTL